MSAPEAISQRDAATRLGISRATVERWVNQGRLNTVRTGERGGARRVLIDDTFHAAKNASRKIPHHTGSLPRESLTSQNASPGSADGIPHAHPALQTSTEPESLTSQPDETRLRTTTSRTLPESLAPDSTKSLTPDIEESLMRVGAPDEPDAASTSASSERPRHPLDAELVPLTSTNSRHARTSQRGCRARRPRRAQHSQSSRSPGRRCRARDLLALAPGATNRDSATPSVSGGAWRASPGDRLHAGSRSRESREATARRSRPADRYANEYSAGEEHHARGAGAKHGQRPARRRRRQPRRIASTGNTRSRPASPAASACRTETHLDAR